MGPSCSVAWTVLTSGSYDPEPSGVGRARPPGHTPPRTPDAPSTLRASQAWPTASQGDGMSRKTASAMWLTPKPLRHTSWLCTVTQRPTPCSWNSSRAFSARCWWNSTVCRWPVGAMVRMMAWDTEPLPVPGGQDEYQADCWGHAGNSPSSPRETQGPTRSASPGYRWASLVSCLAVLAAVGAGPEARPGDHWGQGLTSDL